MRRLILVLPLFAVLVACNRGSAGRPIKVGSSASGSLTDQDPVMRGNRGPYQVWTLRAKRGQRLVIDLTSSAFDPFLVVRDAEGFLVSSDDDSGDELGARVRTILPRTGSYRLIATAVGATARGEYRLTVSEWVAPEAPRPGAAQTIAVGETKDGVLEPGDEFAGDGPYQDRWTFDLRADQRARVEMRSTDVDSYLMLLGPDGRVVATNDDGLGNRDAVVMVRAPAAGRYTALATTYGDQPKVGAYRIGLAEVSGQFAEAGTVLPIADGETKEGQLEVGDSTTASGGYTDTYEFRAARSGSVVLDLVSTDFDAYLTLRDSTGQQLGTDDDSGGGRNARLTSAVTAAALYRIVVGTFGSGSGSYRLTARLSR